MEVPRTLWVWDARGFLGLGFTLLVNVGGGVGLKFRVWVVAGFPTFMVWQKTNRSDLNHRSNDNDRSKSAREPYMNRT